MSRDCNKCIHHISGSCSAWKCDMQTLEEYRNEVIDEFAERIKTNSELGYIGYLDRVVDEIAEQLKAGKENE